MPRSARFAIRTPRGSFGMQPTRPGVATGPTVSPFAPLFRGARSFVLRRSESAGQAALPVRRVTVIPGLDGGTPPRQILLDGALLPSSSWLFDAAAHTVSWQPASGTRDLCRLQCTPDLHQAQGTLTAPDNVMAVAAELPPITYACDVARNTGAYVTGVAPALQLRWDSASTSWTSANWQPGVLNFTYQMKQQTIVGQTFYGFAVSFADTQTGTAWRPIDGAFGCIIDGNFVFTMSLQGGMSPDRDDRTALPGEAGQIATVFPFQVAFQLSATALDLQGAALTVINAQNGVILGVRGTTGSPSVDGYYALAGSRGAFAVHDGTLRVAGSPVARSRVRGTTLSWQGLDAGAQRASGLPAAGALLFDPAGERFTVANADARGHRMVGEAAEALIARGAMRGGI